MFLKNLKKFKLICSLIVLASWWVILYIMGKLWINISDDYMLGYYLSTIIVIYIIYLILIPIIFNINIKLYIDKIGFKFNNEILILSIALILSMIIGFCLRKPIALSENYWAWLYLLQPPMVEELLFRGVIPYLLYYKYKNKLAPFIISCILFSLIHILLGMNGILNSLLIGSILLTIRIQCTSIIPSMIIHYIINSRGAYAWGLCFIVVVIYEFHWIKNRYNNSKLPYSSIY